MNQDEIIDMARQAGLQQDGDMWFSNLYKTDMDVHISHLEAFAKLVAAKEREACAKVCEDGLNISTSLQALDDMEIWGEKFAKAIRARGKA